MFAANNGNSCTLTVVGTSSPQFTVSGSNGSLLAKQYLRTGSIIGHGDDRLCRMSFSLPLSSSSNYTLSAMGVYREFVTGETLASHQWTVLVRIDGADGKVASASSSLTISQAAKTSPEVETRAERERSKWECNRLGTYQSEMLALLQTVDDYDAVRAVMTTDDFSQVRPSQAKAASRGLDEWATKLEEMDDIPAAAKEYHEAMIATFGALSAMLLSYANGGVFALLAYTDTMDSLKTQTDRAAALGVERCGSAWIDVFGNN